MPSRPVRHNNAKLKPVYVVCDERPPVFASACLGLDTMYRIEADRHDI